MIGYVHRGSIIFEIEVVWWVALLKAYQLFTSLIAKIFWHIYIFLIEIFSKDFVMFPKILGLVFSILVTVSYVIGFMYDASFLEVFGVNYYEMIGPPLGYLSMGGMYLLLSYSNNLTLLVTVLGLVGIFYVPVKRRMPRKLVEEFVDLESVPYILFSVIPIAFLVILPVIPDAKKAAKDAIDNGSDELCVEVMPQCLSGVVLRYRDSKIIFYDSKLKETFVFSDEKLISSTHR